MIGHLVYGEHDFGEMFFCHAPKRIMPESSIAERTVGGRDGAYFQSRKLQPVEVECTMVLREPKQCHERLIEILDEAARHLRPVQQRLYLPTDDQRYYIATHVGTSTVEEFVTSARLTVSFRATDPLRYGMDRTFELPASASTTVRTGGNMPARPVFKATATAGTTSYRARSSTANQDVYIYPNKLDTSQGWNGGELLEIDMESETASVNGQPWPVSLSSSFFGFEDGDKLYTNIASTVEWKERWL